MGNKEILSEIIVQVLGFGLVFLILKYFAWGKLLGAIEARRKKIEDEFLAIERQKESLEGLEKDYRKKLENIDREARLKIQEASNAGLALSRDIQEKARLDSQKLIERAQGEIERDLAQARLKFRDEVVELSGLMTEKIIRQKLNEAEHKKLVEQFIKEMEKV
ncbi:MAG: ATP synthase F0 subunit B [Candidatus Omnitrophica bacterium CG07_land_8_20_14_0_80_50_8]|nr:MAG: ATP synthase F0 subunit B [Candidatus Omnitrophica bacterium CG1_02_49_16]PIU40329.1 MAG: ATP synthase F0 subunit B [Candidatus Omnitrophica bacterium CG07_land_8_20_14_0_80_50_8]